MTIDEQIEFIKKGSVDLIREEDLRKKLERSAKTGKPLRVKLGADPTAPDIHIGHTVVIRKLKAFQELGHTAIFLIGDFTGMIGDPSGKNATRPQLSRKEVLANAETYKKQIFKILDPNKTEIRFNSEWFDKFKASDFIKLASRTTVRQILERKDFSDRMNAEKPIALHELLYPLVQGYDSVALEADIELGGTDQKFNLLVGRELQKAYKQESQVVLTMDLLEGIHGGKKMSKSLNNYIGIDESANEIYRKIMMYVSDELMWKYYELATDLKPQDIEKLRKQCNLGDKSPNDIKSNLAKLIIKDFHSDEEANKAAEEYQASAKSGIVIGSVPQRKVRARDTNVANLLVESGLVKSLKEISKNPNAKILYDNQPVSALDVKEYFVLIKDSETHRLQYGREKALDLIGSDTIISHQNCISEAINSFGYSAELHVLEVKFSLGKTYEYYDVPVSVFEQLKSLIPLKDGIGNFFNKNIRNVYRNIEIKKLGSRLWKAKKLWLKTKQNSLNQPTNTTRFYRN